MRLSGALEHELSDQQNTHKLRCFGSLPLAKGEGSNDQCLPLKMVFLFR